VVCMDSDNISFHRQDFCHSIVYLSRDEWMLTQLFYLFMFHRMYILLLPRIFFFSNRAFTIHLCMYAQ
jgi:hypothetical protein